MGRPEDPGRAAWTVGGVQVQGLSDGEFLARPSYFGPSAAPSARPDAFDDQGAARLPIGCFLLRTDDRLLLVDAGLGPETQALPDGMRLSGGALLDALVALGAGPDAITDVICTHLHADHVGWLFDRRGRPAFPRAAHWAGEGDLRHFVEGSGEMADHVRRGFRALPPGRLHAPTSRTVLTPGVAVEPAPGHTPGSLVVDIGLPGDRLLLIGDAITHPVQLEEEGWHSFGDVDVEEAQQTRDRLVALLTEPGTRLVGSHFPALRPLGVAGSR